MTLFETLGFTWDRAAVPSVIPTHSTERAAFRFHRMMDQYVWDASVLEGNPLTFPEVKTLIDGVTVGGRRISDQNQVLNLIESSKHILALVKRGKFSLDKATFVELHSIVVRDEPGYLARRSGEGRVQTHASDVGFIQQVRYRPIATNFGAHKLSHVFTSGLQALQSDVQQPFEKAAAFFLFGALQLFFFDGNKRTSRLMMNGILMSAGIDAVSVPAAKAEEYNDNMIRFYLTKDATKMIAFLVSCHPDAHLIRHATFD